MITRSAECETPAPPFAPAQWPAAPARSRPSCCPRQNEHRNDGRRPAWLSTALLASSPRRSAPIPGAQARCPTGALAPRSIGDGRIGAGNCARRGRRPHGSRSPWARVRSARAGPPVLRRTIPALRWRHRPARPRVRPFQFAGAALVPRDRPRSTVRSDAGVAERAGEFANDLRVEHRPAGTQHGAAGCPRRPGPCPAE